MSDVHTWTPAAPVKKNQHEEKYDWERHWRAHTAFNETYEVPADVCQLVSTLLSIQGLNSHCWPSIEDLGRKFGNKRTVMKLVASAVELLPQIIRVCKPGGSASNRYYITRMDKWPIQLIKQWEASKLHKHGSRRALTRNPYGVKNAPQSSAQSTPQTRVYGAESTPLIGDTMERGNGDYVLKPKEAVIDLWANQPADDSHVCF